MDNIREAIGEIELQTIDNVHKNWTDRVGYCQPRQPFECNCFPLLTGRIVLTNKKRNLRKYSVVFFLKHFPKKKVFGGPCSKLFEEQENLNFEQHCMYSHSRFVLRSSLKHGRNKI